MVEESAVASVDARLAELGSHVFDQPCFLPFRSEGAVHVGEVAQMSAQLLCVAVCSALSVVKSWW